MKATDQSVDVLALANAWIKVSQTAKADQHCDDVDELHGDERSVEPAVTNFADLLGPLARRQR